MGNLAWRAEEYEERRWSSGRRRHTGEDTEPAWKLLDRTGQPGPGPCSEQTAFSGLPPPGCQTGTPDEFNQLSEAGLNVTMSRMMS